MPKVIYFADVSNGRPGKGATIRFGSGEPCLISIAQTGVLVKRSRYGFMGSILYNEKNVYKAAATAMALSARFPDSLLPYGFSDPVLSAFANAVLHCTTCAEVAVVLNEALNTAPMDAPPPTKDGATPENAIRIRAANSIEGIPKLYATLTAMFGTPKKDWKLLERTLIHTDDGRNVEKVILSVSDKKKELYFDITEWFRGNKLPEAAIENLLAPHDKKIAVLLPKNEFMTLEIGLSQLTKAQLDQVGLSLVDRASMLDPFLETMKHWKGKEYTSIPEHVTVTALVSVWSNIMGLLASWQPADLLQEEELENLKAIIGGTMKAARNAHP